MDYMIFIVRAWCFRGGSREVVAGGAEIQYMPGLRGRIGPCGVQGQRPGGGSRGAKPPG